MDSFYGDQYLNPYIQPNVLNGGEPTLKYYGSGDVDENDTLDVRDYNLILNSDRSEERRVGKEGRSRWSPDH